MPDFEAPTVLVSDKYDYVELWLKRNSNRKARILWQQAENFYRASLSMPNESRAILAYYCILNAVKALLEAKGIKYSQLHGVSGKSTGMRTSLCNEISTIKSNGIFFSINKYYGSNFSGIDVSLKNVMYNIPFVHRAYTVTYRCSKELFIPLKDPHFVRQNGGSEAWFCAEIADEKYCDNKVMDRQRGWEIDKSVSDKFIIRRKKRFRWDESLNSKEDRINELLSYHQKIRRDIKYIHGDQRLWYYKRNDRASDLLNWPVPSLIFVAMHRLSELTRYDPKKLLCHFECQHNWLLTEFMNKATDNFIDQIASDITGRELMVPGYR